MTTTTSGDRAAKALQSWGANAERHDILKAFEADASAPARQVSTHVDTKSAYTVRTRLARRWNSLVFRVIRTEDGAGQIYVKHAGDERPWPWEVAERRIDTN